MIKRLSARTTLVESCDIIEIKNDGNEIITVSSASGVALQTTSHTIDNELRAATIFSVLHLFLKDEVVVDGNLFNLFEELYLKEKHNAFNYYATQSIASTTIVKGLIENGYKDGLREEALQFS